MKKEIWKSIKGYEGFYEVSNLGRIRSKDRFVKNKWGGRHLRKGVLLKQKTTKQGYLSVTLQKDGILKHLLVHRIVASKFIRIKTKDKIYVNHKDGNKLNNDVSNLEWVTASQNTQHAWDSGLCENTRAATKRRKGIWENKSIMKKVINKDTMEEYDSIKEAALIINIKPSTLGSKLNGRRNNDTPFMFLEEYISKFK